MIDNLTALDMSLCVGYLLLVLGVGLWCSRHQDSNEDYFLGGRRMHWIPIGLSLFAGTFSSLSFVGLPREGAYDDWHLLLSILFIPLVVMPLVGWIYLPLFYRLNLTSVNEYLELRFNRSIRILGSILFLCYAVGWMGNMLLAVGKILQVVLDLSPSGMIGVLVAVGLFATLYTTLGGVKAVVWTDALQAFALGGGMLLVLWLALGKIDGGLDVVIETGQKHEKFAMFDTSFHPKEAKGNFFGACAFGFFAYLAGHAVHVTAVQRYVSMPSIGAARRSLVVNGIMVSLVCALFFLVGTVLFTFYTQTGNPIFAELDASKQGDQLLPTFLIQELPGLGLVGLLVAGLFAAAMSSMDSGINSLTAVAVCDWFRREEIGLTGSRLLTVAFGVAAIGVSLILSMFEGPVFHLLMTIAGTFLGLLLGIFSLGMFVPRANWQGTLIGTTGGLVAILLAKHWGLSFWWDGACTSVSTFIIGSLTSLAFAPGTNQRVQALLARE